MAPNIIETIPITIDKIFDNSEGRDSGSRQNIRIVNAKGTPITMVKNKRIKSLATSQYSARQIFFPILCPPFHEAYENIALVIKDLAVLYINFT